MNVTDDIAAGLAPVKAMLGFYIGGMGAKQRNFHKELMARMGFEAEADRIQELFFEGKRGEAIAAVPDQFADEISLVGPIERIRDRLSRLEGHPGLDPPGPGPGPASPAQDRGARALSERSAQPDAPRCRPPSVGLYSERHPTVRVQPAFR